MTTLYERAIRGELGESLTVSELAELRASDFGRCDSTLLAQLVSDMESRIRAGRIQAEVVVITERTGRFRVGRPYDESRDPPSMRGQMVYVECVVHGGPPPHGAEAILSKREERRLTREQSRALYVQHPEHWSEGARLWAGLPVVAEDAGTAPKSSPASLLSIRTKDEADERISAAALRSLFEELLPPAGYRQSQIDSMMNQPKKYLQAARIEGERGVYWKRKAVQLALSNLPQRESVKTEARRKELLANYGSARI